MDKGIIFTIQLYLHEFSVYLVVQSQMLLRAGHSWSDCGCHVWISVLLRSQWERIWSLLLPFLPFIVPHLHWMCGSWFSWSFPQSEPITELYETIRIVGQQHAIIIAWRIMARSQGSRWSRHTKLYVTLGKWWPCTESLSEAWCWDQWLWLSTRPSLQHTRETWSFIMCFTHKEDLNADKVGPF